jgi:myosin heavy subunit
MRHPAGVLGYVEDTWAKMQFSVLKLQAYTRMFFAHKRFQQHKAAALLFQSSWRGRVARLQYAKDLREHKAAVCIQRHYRGGTQRAEYKKVGGNCYCTELLVAQHMLGEPGTKQQAASLVRHKAAAQQNIMSHGMLLLISRQKVLLLCATQLFETKNDKAFPKAHHAGANSMLASPHACCSLRCFWLPC